MIENVTARSILNSRGEWTIEVTLRSGEWKVAASVPQGESRGSHEVVSLLADQAVKNIVEIIAPVIVGRKLGDQNNFDDKLKKLDGTPNKEKLGGNALLGVSMAYSRLSALSANLSLWQYLHQLATPKHSVLPVTPPRLLSLMIEGGLHAPGASPFQEYLVLPRATTIIESINIITKLYSTLRQLISDRFGSSATRLGDEGAFAPATNDPLAPFALITEASQASGLADKFEVGLDAAADNVSLNPEELNILYDQMRTNYPLRYLEDPFGENNPDDFAALSHSLIGGELATANTTVKFRPLVNERLAKGATGWN